MLQAIRNWYTAHGFLEVETPVLQPLYGVANARPFMTHFNALDMTMYPPHCTGTLFKETSVSRYRTHI